MQNNINTKTNIAPNTFQILPMEDEVKKSIHIKLIQNIPQTEQQKTSSYSFISKVKNLTNHSLDLEDLENLFEKTCSMEEIDKIFKNSLAGFNCHSDILFVGEFIFMKMYELLREMESKTAVVDSKVATLAIQINSQTEKIRRPIKTQINKCKNYILYMLNGVRLLQLHSQELNPNINKYIETIHNIDSYWSELRLESKILLQLIHQSNCKCNDTAKKYIKFINLFNTIYESHENKKALLSWLYYTISEAIDENDVNSYSFETLKCNINTIKRTSSFALQNARDYLNSIQETISFIKSKEKEINKILKNKTEFKKITINLELLVVYLKSRILHINEFNIFFESSEFTEKMHLFFEECQHPYSGLYDNTKIDIIFDLLKTHYLNYSNTVHKLFEYVEFTTIKSNLKSLHVIFKHQQSSKNLSNVTMLINLISKFNDHNVATARPLIQSVANSLKLTENILNAIQSANLWRKKLVSEENIIHNNSFTLVNPLLNDLLSIKEENLPLEIQTLFTKAEKYLGLFISLSSMTKGLIHNKGFKICYLHFKEHGNKVLNDTLNTIKELINYYKSTDKEKTLKIINICKEITLWKKHIIDKKESAFAFFSHENESLYLNQKEELLLQNSMFATSIELLQSHPLNNLKITIQQELSHSSSEHNLPAIRALHAFLKVHLQFFTKIDTSITALKTLLLPNDGEQWKLTKDNLLAVERTLSQLQLLRDRRPQDYNMILNEEVISCFENERVQMIMKFAHFIDTQVKDLMIFLWITLPMTQKWFNKAKNELKESIKLEKRKQSKKKNFKKTSKKSSEDSSDSNEVINKPAVQKMETTVLIDEQSIENPQEETSEVIFEEIVEQPTEIKVEDKKPKIKEKSPTKDQPLKGFKSVSYRKIKSSSEEKLSFWEETSLKVETVYGQFCIYQLTSEQESYWNLFWRYQEFEKSQHNIHFNLGLLKEVSKISCEKIPAIVEWVWSQRWCVVTDCSLKGMVSTLPISSEEKKDFNLYTHDGIKLFKILGVDLQVQEIPMEIQAIQEQLNHSYVGRIPQPFVDYQPIDKKFFAERRLKLLTEHVERQQMKEGKIIPKTQLEQMRNSPFNFLNTTAFFASIENDSLTLGDFYRAEKEILIWVEDQTGKEEAVFYAKERIIQALKQCRELLENLEIREKAPTLYCTMIADLTNRLMSNILHLYLAKNDLLKGEIGEKKRPVVYCHHPLKLWKLVTDNKLFDENQEITEAMERYSSDSRYPYGKRVSTEERLVEIFEIQTALTASTKIEKKSVRIKNLIAKHFEEGENVLEIVMDGFETDLKKCFDIIEVIINK